MSIKIIAQNRQASFNYHLEEFFEAGLVLTGVEVKSIKAGQITITGSYIRPHNLELYLIDCNIKEYFGNPKPGYDPIRKRKLLLHKKELNKLANSVASKGYTIVPVKVYLKSGLVKIEIALAKGKNAPDKRNAVKEREGKRAIARAVKMTR